MIEVDIRIPRGLRGHNTNDFVEASVGAPGHNTINVTGNKELVIAFIAEILKAGEED